MSVQDKLTRELAIRENMDPRGIKWGIFPIKGSALYEVQIVEGHKNSAIPEEVHGRWTKPTLAQAAIETYLRRAWDENDVQVQKQQRKKAVEETISP